MGFFYINFSAYLAIISEAKEIVMNPTPLYIGAVKAPRPGQVVKLSFFVAYK